MMRLIFLGLIILSFFGCRSAAHDPALKNSGYTAVPVHYAGGFTISRSGSDFLINITNPWQQASQVTFSYILSDTLKKSVIKDVSHLYIKTPVKRVVCLSTTHIGFIGFLDEISSISGISGTGYIAEPSLLRKISHDSLPDVGYDENLNFELILKLKPDVVFAYGVSGSVTNTIRKLNEMGIPVVLIAEYLEEEPLAKMEWLKVFGAFFGKWDLACAKFDSAAVKYEHYRRMASGVKERPTVLLGLPWRGTWYISGGKSYVARLVEDAGGKYVFSSLDYKDSRPMALEEVYSKALDTQYWLNTGDATSISDVIAVDNRFRNLPAVGSGKVYNNNKLSTAGGGNAIFESGVVEPEKVLEDIIYILHPQLLPSYQLKYYRRLQ
jgi:iron complex transport system substrate-binding protein